MRSQRHRSLLHPAQLCVPSMVRFCARQEQAFASLLRVARSESWGCDQSPDLFDGLGVIPVTVGVNTASCCSAARVRSAWRAAVRAGAVAQEFELLLGDRAAAVVIW